MTTCRECYFFAFAMNPETKRKLPSKEGRCTWKPPWPQEWPLAFWIVHAWGGGSYPTPPVQQGVYCALDASNCSCFEAIAAKKGKGAGQVEIDVRSADVDVGRMDGGGAEMKRPSNPTSQRWNYYVVYYDIMRPGVPMDMRVRATTAEEAERKVMKKLTKGMDPGDNGFTIENVTRIM